MKLVPLAAAARATKLRDRIDAAPQARQVLMMARHVLHVQMANTRHSQTLANTSRARWVLQAAKDHAVTCPDSSVDSCAHIGANAGAE